MRRLLLAVGLLTVVGLAAPRPAAAGFSISLGLPGFAFFAADPYPAPVVYPAPPVVYYPTYYAPAPAFGVTYYSGGHRGRGWHGHEHFHKHGRHGHWR